MYIGRLQYPERKIRVDDDDKAHLDYEAPKVIKFIHASKGHEFMEGAVLPPSVGVTHDVFGESYSRLDQTVNSGAEQPSEGAAEETKEELPILQRFKHYYVKEVVREPRMNFQRVPKLGSYMAIPLVYKSCLFDEAVTAAIEAQIDYWKRVEEQEQEKQAFEVAQAQAKEQAEAQGAEWEPEEREWEQLRLTPNLTQDEKYVVCLDTMGQDRELTDE